MEETLSPGQMRFIRKRLRSSPRDLLLFELVLRSALPIGRLLSLRVRELRPLARGDRSEPAPPLADPLPLGASPSLRRAWIRYLAEFRPREDDYVFRSRKGAGPLRLSSVSNLVKRWLSAAGLEVQGPLRFLRALPQPAERQTRPAPAVSSSGRRPNGSSLGTLEPALAVAVHESVYAGLFQAIVSGRIPPGARLLPEEIARRMNVSRMPVREAFHRLHAAGLVTAARRKGVTVNVLSRENLNEIQEIRILIETFAAGRAARRCSSEALSRMEALHERYVEALTAGEGYRVVSINRDFHLAVYAEADMPILHPMISGLLDRIVPYFHILLRQVTRRDPHIHRTIRNHLGMLEGMRAHDPLEVSKWLAADHEETTRRMLAFFSEKA